MTTLDQRADFHDDGGTRAWRANQATWQNAKIVYESEPKPTLRAIIRGIPFWRAMWFFLFWSFSPLIFFIVAILVLGLTDSSGRQAYMLLGGLGVGYGFLFLSSLGNLLISSRTGGHLLLKCTRR